MKTNPGENVTAVEIISRKRDGHKLSEQEIKFIVEGYTRGDIPDYQMSAFLMAVLFQGMSYD
jgi:pyrimidine-nucleoside phosphorylase